MDYEKEKYRRFFESIPENKREEIGDKIAKLMSGEAISNEANTPSCGTEKGGNQMTLDEAIKHCEEKAQQCGDCGKDHAQLAEWLKELKRLKEAKSVTLWIARNSQEGFDSINLFQHKPRKSKYGRYFVPSKEDLSTNLLPQDGEFPSVTFENSPQKVELRLIGK